MSRPLRWFPAWLAIGIGGVCLDAWLSLSPSAGSVAVIPDKLAHFLIYFVLAGWFAGLFQRHPFAVVFALTTLGGLLEILQPLTGRNMEFMDGLVNFAGVLAGWLLVQSLPVNLFTWLESRISPTQ